MRKGFAITACMGVLALLLLSIGCVTEIEEPKPLARTRLVVTRSGDTATLQWQSKSDLLYTLYQAESREAGSQWAPLPGALKVQGTGGLMKYEDKLPIGRDRHYRIQATPMVKVAD